VAGHGRGRHGGLRVMEWRWLVRPHTARLL
jgi:hypothetical protein